MQMNILSDVIQFIDVQKPQPIIVRYTVTVGGSTWTIGYLSKRGIMKTDQIKDELQERSDQIKVISSTLCSQHCVIVFICYRYLIYYFLIFS